MDFADAFASAGASAFADCSNFAAFEGGFAFAGSVLVGFWGPGGFEGFDDRGGFEGSEASDEPADFFDGAVFALPGFRSAWKSAKASHPFRSGEDSLFLVSLERPEQRKPPQSTPPNPSLPAPLEVVCRVSCDTPQSASSVVLRRL